MESSRHSKINVRFGGEKPDALSIYDIQVAHRDSYRSNILPSPVSDQEKQFTPF